MPHIKFKDFPISDFKPKNFGDTAIVFIAKDVNRDSKLLGIELKGYPLISFKKR